MNGPGFSFFVGPADGSLWSDAELAAHVETAANLGFREAFVSLFFMDSFFDDARFPPIEPSLVRRLDDACQHAASLGVGVMIDVAPYVMDALGAANDLSVLARMGVTRLRADYGFSAEELAALSRGLGEAGISLVLNASSLGWGDRIGELERAGARVDMLVAGHNYYPRRETALDARFAAECSRPLLDRGLSVAAFACSAARPLPPLGEGLPTLEDHRGAGVPRQATELLGWGVSDTVFLGDMGDERELSAVMESWRAWVSAGRPNAPPDEGARPPPPPVPVSLRVRPAGELGARVLAILDGAELFNRADPPALGVRASTLRGALDVEAVAPMEARSAFSVTVDNNSYPRYAGEVGIPLVDLPPDERVTVLGRVDERDRRAAAGIGPGQPFRLRLYHP